MRVFDRYDGREVDLPAEIAPGRFRLLGDAVLSSDVRLCAGQVVLGDSWNNCSMKDDGAVIKPIGHTGLTEGHLDLLELAVATLARGREDKRISPLIPASVGQLAELAELECALTGRISHLKEINQRPRLSMHYESEVAPLPRVRKLAPGAITHLAAHSEDWHRRTLSGIEPKRVLGLFSEDELTIYENKVYACLLDKLDKYLRRRRAQVAGLVKQCEEALTFSGAENLDYRLRTDLYALWGNAFSDDETQHLLDASQDALQKLDSLHKQVRVLRNGSLYLRLPRDLRVPEQLRETNILQHDQHYRHLRTLWRLHQQRSFGKPLTAREIADRNLKLFDDYIVYVGMLCHRALAEFRLLERRDGKCLFAGTEVTFERQGDEWHLDCGAVHLVIVPTFHFEEAPPGPAVAGVQRVLVSLLGPDSEDTEEEQACTPDSTCFTVNPCVFRGLEKIKMLIETFFWRKAFSQYGRSIGKLPTAAVTWLEAKGLVQRDNRHELVMLSPLHLKAEREFLEWLNSAAVNEQTQARIRRCVDNLRALASCRECGGRAQLDAAPEGFQARCSDCAARWRLWMEDGKRIAEMSVDSPAASTFWAQGARHFRLELP